MNEYLIDPKRIISFCACAACLRPRDLRERTYVHAHFCSMDLPTIKGTGRGRSLLQAFYESCARSGGLQETSRG